MKNIILAFFTTIAFICKSQTTVDTAYLKCHYNYKYLQDTTDNYSIRRDKMALLIGKKVSRFYSYRQFRRDSLEATGVPAFIDTQEGKYIFKSYANPEFKNFPQGSNINIFKNYPSGKVTFTDKIIETYLYDENIPVQNWVIQLDTATISSYKCQQATCTFRGRNYIAWFTREIPVNEGPFKFGSLPGLIVQIEDDKAHYSCTLTRIERGHEAIVFNTNDYIKTSRKEYTNVYRKYIRDPMKFMDEILGSSTSHSGDPAVCHFDIMERGIR